MDYNGIIAGDSDIMILGTSDIDLAVSGGNYSAFAVDVDEETSTLLEYDFVNLDGSVQAELLAVIQKEGKVLYEKI